MVQLASQLQVASNEAKELALKVEELDAKAMAHKLKLHLLGHSYRSKDEKPFDTDEANHNHHSKVSTELGDVKKQLSNLRLEMASALETKAKAEKELEDSFAMARLYSNYIEEIKEEITISMVEEALTIAAQIDADKEFREREARHEAEAAQFSQSIKKIKIRIKDLHKEINYAEKLQMKLAITASDITVLQSEIELIRAMDKNLHSSCSTEGGIEKRKEAPEMNTSLQSAKAELETAKKDLLSLKEKGFQLMAEMDATRAELQHIADKKERSSSIERYSDSSLEHLNHKLHKTMSKLEAASLTEERAEALVSNLSAALQQLQADVDAAKRDAELTSKETKALRMEIEKTKSYSVLMEERIQAAMEELKLAIALEAVALEKLRTITDSATSDKAVSSLYSTTISIYKFEYYYLIKQVKAAQEIADQKVAAAQAWIEALVIKDKAETAHRRRLSSSKNGYVSRKSTKNKSNAHELDKKNVQSLNLKLAIAMPRRSITVSGVSGASRRAKTRRSSISSGRQSSVVSSTTCLAARRNNIMLNLVKFLGGRRSQKQP